MKNNTVKREIFANFVNWLWFVRKYSPRTFCLYSPILYTTVIEGDITNTITAGGKLVRPHGLASCSWSHCPGRLLAHLDQLPQLLRVRLWSMMLYRYFEWDHSALPKPHGSLSVPASTIAAANEAVKKVLDIDTGPRAKNAACSSRRGAYEHFTPKEKARIGKRAAEHGVTATLRFFSKAFPGRSRLFCLNTAIL